METNALSREDIIGQVQLNGVVMPNKILAIIAEQIR